MRGKIVPNIICSFIDKIVGKKMDNMQIKTYFLKNERGNIMVKRGK